MWAGFMFIKERPRQCHQHGEDGSQATTPEVQIVEGVRGEINKEGVAYTFTEIFIVLGSPWGPLK